MLSSLILGVLMAGSANPIEITLGVVKSRVMVGEPVVIQLTLRSSVAVQGFDSHLKALSQYAPFRILVDRGHGLVPYREHEIGGSSAPPDVAIPIGGEQTAEYVLSTDSNIDDFMFPAPGTYRLVAEYRHPELGAIRSNEIAIAVEPPSDAERPVLEELRRLGHRTLAYHGPNSLAYLEPLVEQYPNSVYLQELRLNDLQGKLSQVGACYNPGSIPGERGGPDCTTDTQRRRYQSLLALAQDVASVEGVFRPEALLELAGVYKAVDNSAAEQATLREIVEEYPNRVRAVRLAKEGLDEGEPPDIDLKVTPATLWPPNHKLVPVTVAVTVRDDTDPTPAVKLLSITCDDQCDADGDIVGAALGSDDREFELRAERRGAGKGRTYAITYLATDAAGNEAKAMTTVVVPHDQGQ